MQTLKKYKLNVTDFLNSANDLTLCIGLLSIRATDSL